MHQTNLKGVILPTVSSSSSGDLRPDVSLTSTDVRSEVTTKGGEEAEGVGVMKNEDLKFKEIESSHTLGEPER